MRKVKSGTFAGITSVIMMLNILPAAAEAALPPVRLVDMHTAGLLPKGTYQSQVRMYQGTVYGTGLLVDFTVGITDRFSIGLGYGGDGIVGRGRNFEPNPFPGCLVKYRLFEENYFLPGFTIGYEYQGFGGIAGRNDFGYRGYVYKSQGLFAAASKSYLFLKTLRIGFHGDIDMNMEDINAVAWPDIRAGFDFEFNEELLFVAEYDLGFNTKDPVDPAAKAVYARPQDGYLHAGVRWVLSKSFAVEFDVRDITEKRRSLDCRRIGWSREIKLAYTASM